MPEVGGVGLITAFFAGAISFLSPCVLPLVPGYLSAVTGVSVANLEQAGWRSVIPSSLLFIASFSSIFIVLGLSATGVGQALRINTLINQGDVILSGGATPLTAIKVVANFLVPLTVANLGLLGARGSQPRMSTSSKKAARANQN